MMRINISNLQMLRREDFDKIKSNKLTRIEYLKSQFRVKGGNDYVRYIEKLLSCSLFFSDKPFNVKEYEFIFFDSVDDLVSEIRK